MEPPGAIEEDSSEAMDNVKDTCEQNKSQLESLKEIMLRNKQSLKKKEEEVQEYARKLSKIKSRAKLSRRSKDGATSSTETAPQATPELASPEVGGSIDDISLARTPQAKSSLLQRKLAENRKIFEQRSKEMTEIKRAVEEKVEAIRQQLDERDLSIVETQRDRMVTPVRPIVLAPQVITPPLQLGHLQDKDNRIAELSNRVVELEATVLDLQENLKEKDSVIDARTKAITLLSADLSKRGKTTLDTLEETKDEMRTMQENFVLLESSLKNKNENLLEQLHERNDRVAELENVVKGFEERLEKQRLAESASADFSRSAMDTLADTKDAMKSMQENFVLIESTLKSKNDHLLEQLEEREAKLTEAEARIFQLESGAGLVKEPAVADLQYKLEKLEQSYRHLQDEKYELQKNIVELQEKIIANESSPSNGLIVEKDNRIAELENLIEELRRSNELLEEESKAELQKQIADLTSKNEEYSNKINNLERLVHDLESEKNDLAKRVPGEGVETKEDARVQRLTRELEDLNKSMIKLKAQHKSKVKSLQKQLENFKMVSDANAELVKLGNQVTLLEEEKGNLQLSLVDFDELKASAGDWQGRVADLDSKVSAQATEIEAHIQAIATLENQKLDLMQELHAAKQEISTLEAENAESENLRVTAEMKIVELEEQLEWLHKSQKETEESESAIEQEQTDLLKKFDVLKEANQELYENFVKLEEKNGSNAGSSESFETINDTDKIELQKKIDVLTREKSDLLMKLSKLEEKGGSSNSGSTESFERVPAQSDTLSKIEILTRDNNDLTTKVVKLEERLAQFEDNQSDAERESWSSSDRATMQLQERLKHLTSENSELVIQLTKLQERLAEVSCEDPEVRRLRERLGILTEENNQLVIKTVKLEEINANLSETLGKVSREKEELASQIDRTITDSFARERLELIEKLEKLNREKESVALERQELHEEISTLLQKSTEESSEGQKEVIGESPEEIEIAKRIVTVASLEAEIEECKRLIAEQKDLIEEMKIKLSEKEEELETKGRLIAEQEAAGKSAEILKRELEESLVVIEEWKLKCAEMQSKMEVLEAGKLSIDEGLRSLQNEYKHLLEQSEGKDVTILELREELESTIARFESRLQMEVGRVAAKDAEIETLMGAIASKDKELRERHDRLQHEMTVIDTLEDQLNAYRTESQQSSLTIKSLREEVDRLEERVRESKSQEEFDDLVKRVDETEKRASSLENKLKEQVELNSQLRLQIEQQVTFEQQVSEDADARLGKKDKEIAELLEQLRDASGANSELQKQLEGSNAYVNDLLKELNGEYKKLEQLKAKHTEDTTMQNRRLEDLLEELNSRTQENECLRSEFEEKRRAFGEEAKVALESRITALEKELQESETRSQSLREKMKVYAANLKKKATQCQELEARVAELEEKWSSEKDEKEATNRRIQELEKSLVEKENRIAEVEGSFARAESEATAALENVERLTKEIGTSRAEVIEISKEMEKLRQEVERHSAEVEVARCESRRIASEYESYKVTVLSERERELQVLEEAKENARELSVRMQVMEAEYVEQLGLIQKLKTENGLLSSKETEINERLENIAKESEERRVLLERLQSGKENAEPLGALGALGALESVEESKRSGVDRCERCEQCQMLVQALEAKLQERDAEIENLDNELANSIGNFVQMREALRYSDVVNQSSSSGNVSIEESYNQLLFQHNALTSSNEEIKERLNFTIRENQELTEKINGLQALNSALQERIDAVERELVDGREVVAKLQNIDLLYSELLEKSRRLEEELERVRREFSEKEDQFHESSVNLEGEIQSLRKDLSESQRKASDFESEFEGQKEENLRLREEMASSRKDVMATPVAVPLLERVAPEKSAPELFDASKIFGAEPTSNAEQLVEISRLRNMLSERDEKDALVVDERDRLSRQLAEERVQVQESNAEYARQLRNLQQDYERLQQELASAQEVLVVRNREIEALNVELNNVGAQLQMQFERQGTIQDNTVKLQSVINSKDDEILKIRMELNAAVEMTESLTAARDEVWKLLQEKIALVETLQRERTGFIGELDELKFEKQEAEKIVDNIIAVAEERVNTINESKLSAKFEDSGATGLVKVENRLTEILGELENVKRERDALVACQEAYRDRISELEGRLAANERGLQETPDTVVEAARLQELEERIGTILQERDLLQLQVNDLTRSLDSSKGSIYMQEEPLGSKVPVVLLEEKAPKVDQPEVGSGWDVESTGKLEVDEDGWGWNAEEARLSEEHHTTAAPLVPSLEVQLETRIAELEDRIRDLESEKQSLEEENKLAQTRSGKLVRKLKEYKVQNDNLHQQLKSQKSTVGFCDLDSAIEEELKLQIANLEKALIEVKDELKKMIAEKESLGKRLDVLTAANERLVEMKERQDLDMEVCQIRNKELANKVQSLEWQLQAAAQGSSLENAPTSQTSDQEREETQGESDVATSEIVQKYKEELDDLRGEMEALATENEQLQKLLEEHRQQRLAFESKVSAGGVEDTAMRNNELQSRMDKLKEEYDLLRKQYEQSLMDANDQITAMRQNCEIFKSELEAKTEELEAVLQDRTRISDTESTDLRMQLREALEEKAALIDKVESLKSMEEKFTSATVSVAEMSELLNARVQEVADLKQELQQLYVERTQAEERLEERERKLSEDLKNKQEEIEALKQAFSEKENELVEQRSVERVSAIVSEATQEVLQKHALELESKEEMIRTLRDRFTRMESSLECATAELEGHRRSVDEQHSQIRRLEALLTEKEETIANKEVELQNYIAETHRLQTCVSQVEAPGVEKCTAECLAIREDAMKLRDSLGEKEREVERLQTDLENERMRISALNQSLREKEAEIEDGRETLVAKEDLLRNANQRLKELQEERERLQKTAASATPQTVDGLPVFRMPGSDEEELRSSVERLKSQLETKQVEIEHLQYILSENTYPKIIQELQDNINQLHNQKEELEVSLETATRNFHEELGMRERELEELRRQEEAATISREGRHLHEQEEILRLQNELHQREQEINELRYILAEKSAQLSLQASLEPQSDEFELRETVQRLNAELYSKDQEVEKFKKSLAEREGEVAKLATLERLLNEHESTIARLNSEKEAIRVEAEESLRRRSNDLEVEIDAMKERLAEEKEQLLRMLEVKDEDLHNIRVQLEEGTVESNRELHRKEEELSQARSELAEKERRLAELSITKDAEIHNLRVQIQEKEVRIEELHALTSEEERQLVELRELLTAKDEEINLLKQQLAGKVQEYELLQRALKREIRSVEAEMAAGTSAAARSAGEAGDGKESASNELELALYMLHQRDVRCEELTVELMQLLEERDTLQLRLSNAIRINEELRKAASISIGPKDDQSPGSADEPIVEQPSPSKSEGPVEIAKEAIDAPIGEDKEALAQKYKYQNFIVGSALSCRYLSESFDSQSPMIPVEPEECPKILVVPYRIDHFYPRDGEEEIVLASKLSQLHNVGLTRDVRLRDERELRHTQQMSLLAHKDVLSTLPPEAAARLVNANYTLSRDVQSQSSVLLNWLWGKSTPKVVHM